MNEAKDLILTAIDLRNIVVLLNTAPITGAQSDSVSAIKYKCTKLAEAADAANLPAPVKETKKGK